MRNRDQLSHDQLRFLRACRDEAGTFDMLVERFKIKPWRVSKWLRAAAFRQALAETYKEIRRKRILEFELAARWATNLQSQIIAGKTKDFTHVQRQTSRDLLELYFNKHRKKYRVKGEQKPIPVVSFIHPDVSPAEARKLLSEMDKGLPLTDEPGNN